MNFLNKLNSLAAAACVFSVLMVSTTAMAQQPTPPAAQQTPKQSFSEQELKQFANATNRLMAIQKEGEQKMVKILEEEKLSVDKFNEMALAHQQQKLDEVKATPEEMSAFNKAAQRMMEMQPEMQKQVEDAIQKEGMTLANYERIMIAYRQDQALQERVNKLMAL